MTMPPLVLTTPLRSTAGETTSTFYQDRVPDFVWPALDRLYHSIFCSEPHLRIHQSVGPRTAVWVSRQAAVVDAVLLFEVDGHVARVVNEVITLPPAQLSAFARDLFAHDSRVSAIVLHAVTVDAAALAYPTSSAAFSEDFVLPLPANMPAYLASLSRQTREKIRYHTRRSQRKAPGLSFHLFRGADICADDVERVLAFNRARMEKKGREFGMSDQEAQRLGALLRERGLMALITLDGKPCAGLLCTIAGDDLFMHVIAHDPALDDLRLGFLCCVSTIEAAIADGLQHFHFLWGHYDYKTRLGGHAQPLQQLVLFKHRPAMLLHPRLLMRQLVAGARNFVRQKRR